MKIASLFLISLVSILSQAQKKVLTYPFEFEKSFFAKGDYDAYFLDNQNDSTFALILKDNKKAEYALLDKKFKVIAKIPSAIGNTIFDENIKGYTGGTTAGNEYHFIYSAKSEFQMETVNFNNKTVSHKTIFELPKAQKQLVSFSDYNKYYSITTNDKTSTLEIYIINAKGELIQKTIAFKIPEDASRRRDKLSTYLNNLKLIKSEEEPDLSNAVIPAKLFSSHGTLDFVINDQDNPTHIFTINLTDFSVQEKFIDYSDLIAKGEKGNLYISSFLRNNKLFSLVLNKKTIRIAVHDLSTSTLLNKFEITEESGTNLFAKAPVTERRLGKKVNEKDVDDIKKLIKALTKGTEGIMVSENKLGKLIVTVGTYDFIPLSHGGGGSWAGGFQQTQMTGSPNLASTGSTVYTWNPNMYYRPGLPGYSTTSARYYNTTYFKILLDPSTLKVARGSVPEPMSEQIKDYIETIDIKSKATNQFSIGKDQYYGYYDRDTKSYIIDQVRIR